MAPIYVKGGIWTNVEDEILKLSISKYGLNQWARVSSLLLKKTAKQCKARWNEWLDPGIKKIEWSLEEDQKLARAIQMLPNQWRSIANIVGRTLTQCIERYQKLLDNGDQEFGLQGSGLEAMGSVGVEIGDLHLDPESKPAKLEDQLDDEEKEMISEARARLANTQGKKAKRKQRERMLEESRRISLLQKRREMKAAGINIRLNNKRKDHDKRFDYNATIPVYHEVPKGKFNTEEEVRDNSKDAASFENDVKRNGMDNIEHAKQKKKRQTTQKEVVREEQIFKRRKVDLPEPATQLESQPVERKTDVSSRLLALPKPQNDIDIIVDDLSDSDEEVVGKLVEPVEMENNTPEEAEHGIEKETGVIFNRAGLPVPKAEHEVKDDPIDIEMMKLIKSEAQDIDPKLIKEVNDLIAKELKSQEFNVVSEPLPVPIENVSTLSRLVQDIKQFSNDSKMLEIRNSRLNNGYIKRFQDLISKKIDLEQQSIDLDLKLKTYQEIFAFETDSIRNRLSRYNDSIERLAESRSIGEQRYEDLMS